MCDDNNFVDGDGCTADCQLEDKFSCKPVDPDSDGPDICYCESYLEHSKWRDQWEVIEISFKANITYYDGTAEGTNPKSLNSATFCTQLLAGSVVSELGTGYSCHMDYWMGRTVLTVHVGRDSELADDAFDYETEIELNDVLRVEGCNAPIYHNYKITNLPQPVPLVMFEKSVANNKVPYCTQELTIDILSSLGMTQRAPRVTWLVASMSPSSSSLKNNLENDVLDDAKDMLTVTIPAYMIKNLKGRTVTFQATV